MLLLLRIIAAATLLLLPLFCCCATTNNTSFYVLRHTLSLSSLLASPSFGLLAYMFLLYGLVYCSLLSYNMFSVWVLRSLLVLPSILPPYILPPKGEVVFSLNGATPWFLVLLYEC